VLFYRDVAALTPAATPDVYFAEIDGKERFVLLLEDLSHYRLGDQIEGCAAADAGLCMVELGELHASFWNDVDRPELAFIPYHYPSHHSDGLQQGAIAGWDPMMQLFGDSVPGHLRALKDRYLAAIPRMQQWIASPPLTVVHGDFRMDNLFFGTSPDQAPVAAVDWQGCLRAKAVQDLGYLLSGSVPIDDRRAHERDLLDKWHEVLVEGGVGDYRLDQVWEDYRRSILYQWTVVVVIAGTLDPSNERGRAWMTQMVERAVAAIDDLDLLALLPEFE
jgi:Ecdysteroid kinase-like family